VKRAKHIGFTLIELLVVIFIISIVSGVALLSIGHNQSKKIQSFTNQVAETLLLAQQQAMLQPAVIGIYLTEQALQFYDLHTQPGGKSKWLPRSDRLLETLNVPDGMEIKLSHTLKLKTQETQKERSPQIIISSNGDVTPFMLYLGANNDKPRYVIQGDVNGSITQQTIS